MQLFPTKDKMRFPTKGSMRSKQVGTSQVADDLSSQVRLLRKTRTTSTLVSIPKATEGSRLTGKILMKKLLLLLTVTFNCCFLVKLSPKLGQLSTVLPPDPPNRNKLPKLHLDFCLFVDQFPFPSQSAQSQRVSGSGPGSHVTQ